MLVSFLASSMYCHVKWTAQNVMLFHDLCEETGYEIIQELQIFLSIRFGNRNCFNTWKSFP